MSYVNTGYARNALLTVTKGNHTENYDIRVGFEAPGGRTYPSLSDQGFALLSDEEYQARLEDFLEYVCSLESGLASDCPDLTIGSVIYDTVSCPLPTANAEK